MPELSTAINIWRAVGDACKVHIAGTATDSAVGSITAADHPFQTARTNASAFRIQDTELGVGDEIYWASAMQSSTLTAALTSSATSFTVASGTGFSTSTARPYLVAIDQELIRVTLSSATFTVLERGCFETRAAAHVSGATVYGPKQTPNPNSIAAYAPSTGVFTMGVTSNIDPGTTGQFDIFGRGVTLADVRAAVNKAILSLYYEDYVPLTLVGDGDMSSPGYASWTASGSPTVSKVSDGNVMDGKYALRVLATVANDYVQSVTHKVHVSPTYAPTWFVRAMVAADVGTGTLRAYDVTNSAEIHSETWSERGTGILQFTFDLPSTCEALAFQLESDTSTSDVYWGYVIAYPIGTREIQLPITTTRRGQVRGVYAEMSGTGRFDAPIRKLLGGQIIPDPMNSRQFRYRFDAPLMYPPFLHVVRPGEMMVADDHTTFVDRELLTAAASYYLCAQMAKGPASDAGARWRIMQREFQKDWAALAKTQVSGPAIEAGYPSAW